MSVTGDAQSAPLRVGYPVADTMGGITAAFAIAAALFRRERSGEGEFIDVSMLEASLVAMGWAVSNWLIAGVKPQPMGNENMTACPSGTFRTGDGLLNIAANKQEQFETLCRLIGREELVADPRFAGREDRKRHRFELNAEIETRAGGEVGARNGRRSSTRTAFPPARCSTCPSVLEHPQIVERGLLQDVRIACPGSTVRSASCARASGSRAAIREPASPPPVLGADTEDLLAELGFSKRDVEELARERGHMSDVPREPRRPQTPEDWWSTSIIDMKPGSIRYRGYAIEDLIGRVGFAEMVYLMTRGELPHPDAAKLLEAALVAAVDHGPQAPSIAAARMAITCGVGINNAMASAINMLGDVHGGAGEQCVALYNAIAARLGDGAVSAARLAQAVGAEMTSLAAPGVSHVPGFGHRFHPRDPRAPRLLELVDAAARSGAVSGRFAAIARALEAQLAAEKGRPIPMNIDGATGVIFAELGFPPRSAAGCSSCRARSGALAHAFEEMQSGQRNKGPIPRHLIWTYTGPPPRKLP